MKAGQSGGRQMGSTVWKKVRLESPKFNALDHCTVVCNIMFEIHTCRLSHADYWKIPAYSLKVGFLQKVMAKFSNLSNRHACEPKIVPEHLFPVSAINKLQVILWIHLAKKSACYEF